MGFFDGNLLNESVLNRKNFEGFVGLGHSKKEILQVFAVSLSPADLGESASYAMLDKWCKENYDGLGFDKVFDLLQAITVKKFEDCMLDLGIRGNPSAISIMNEVIRKKEGSGLVTINYVNQLPPEGEESKADDNEQ